MTEIPARLSVVTLGAGHGRSPLVLPGPGLAGAAERYETWTGFLLGGVLLALFPLRDLTAEAAPGGRVANEISRERLR